MAQNPIQVLDIELSAWILADGNYEFVSFAVGAQAKFALEFSLRTYSLCREPLSLIASAERSVYNASAEVVYRDASAWILDFGSVSAYKTGTGPADVGQRIKGDVSLHVDPFHYYESFAKLADIPPLIYEWQFVGIDMCVNTPERFVSVEKIDLQNDRQNGSTDSYILHCSLLTDRPSKVI